MRLTSALLALALLASALAAQQAAGPRSGNAKIVSLCGGDPALAVMTSDLLEARRDVLAGTAAARAAQARMPQAVRDGKIQVIIGLKEITPSVLDAVSAAGLEVVHRYEQGGLNTLTVRCSDPLQLDAIARLPETRAIVPEPARRTWTGSVTSQGDGSHKASTARTNFGIDGTGYRVGVLSDSFVDVRLGSGVIAGGFLTGSTDQVSGDLPPSIRIIDAGPGGGSDEGNGMAQLIYDLAPGCDIAFASAFTGYAAFATNIAALYTDALAPSDVIVDDVFYYAEPMYQNGPIAVAANNAVAAGVPYFSSAGNLGNQAHERNFVDVNGPVDDTAFPPSGADLHDFGAASGAGSDTHLTLNLPAGGSVVAILHWDEPYGGGLAPGPGSGADLDLYLVNSVAPPGPGNTVGQSSNPQGTPGSPVGDAYEVIVEPSLAPGTYHLCVEHYQGRDDTSTPPLLLSLIVDVSGSGASIADAAYLGDRTIYGHAAAQDVRAVAALFYYEEQTGGGFIPPGSQLDVESFSSLGGWSPTGIPFYFSDDGNTRTPSQRNKPELTGIDGTDTTFFGSGDVEPNGFPNFFGTSAAAPHVAGVAALMLDQADNFGFPITPAVLYAAMQNTARDAEAAGTDALSGYGLVDALMACGAVPVELSVFTAD